MAREYSVIDSDQHTFFPKDYYEKWWPKSIQHLAPKLITDPAGGTSWLWGENILDRLVSTRPPVSLSKR